MCEPVSIIAGVGLAVSVGGMIFNGVKQKQQADAAAAQEQRNAAEAARLAELEGQRAEYQVSVIRQKADQIIAAQANRTIGSGFSLTGTAARIMESTDLLSEQDVNITRLNAAQIAMGYKNQGLNFQAQANLLRQKGDNYLAGSILGAAGSAIGGAGSIWKYYDNTTKNVTLPPGNGGSGGTE